MAPAANQSGNLSQTGSLRATGRSGLTALGLERRQQQPDQDEREGEAREQRLHDADRQREVEDLPERRQKEVGGVDQRQDFQETRDATGAAAREQDKPAFRPVWRENSGYQCRYGDEYERRTQQRRSAGSCRRIVEQAQIVEAAIEQECCRGTRNGARRSNPGG